MGVVTGSSGQNSLADPGTFLPGLKSALQKDEDRGKLIFTFVSSTHEKDRGTGLRVPEDGIHKLADLAHKYDIPVTWLIDVETGTTMQEELNEWHDTYGDDLGVSLKEGAGEIRESLRELFPWSEVSIIAETSHEGDETQVAQENGFSTIWGSCWEQVGIDGITDRGAPWGLFYVSEDNYKIPSRSKGGIISGEWTSRDLLKSLHTGRPTTYSSDPNDVARAGICTGDDIEYWKTLFDNYIRNISNNEFVFFQQHQEAHEMENNRYIQIYTPEEIDETEEMLDRFFAYVKSYEELVEFKTLPEAVELYKTHYEETAPSVMLFDDAEVKAPIFWYGRESTATGPWPQTLLYYDKDCQMAFIEGGFMPVMLRDYINRRTLNDPEYYHEYYQPDFDLDIPWEDVELSEVPIRIQSRKAMPYGAAFWYDFEKYRITQVDGAELIGPIEQKVALLRLNLEEGENWITVHLERKS